VCAPHTNYCCLTTAYISHYFTTALLLHLHVHVANTFQEALWNLPAKPQLRSDESRQCVYMYAYACIHVWMYVYEYHVCICHVSNDYTIYVYIYCIIIAIIVAVNEPRHTYEWFMSHLWMSLVTLTNESCHTWMSHVTHVNESCHTYEWVTLHIWMSRFTHMHESRHMYECELCDTYNELYVTHRMSSMWHI